MLEEAIISGDEDNVSSLGLYIPLTLAGPGGFLTMATIVLISRYRKMDFVYDEE